MKNTKLTEFHETVNGSGEGVEKILIGEIEQHETSAQRYCRYVHIVTEDAELVLELYADTPNALALRNVSENARYILAEPKSKK